MAKIITFSMDFPKGHSRAGSPTHFPEKIFNALGVRYWTKVKYLDLNYLNPDLDKDLLYKFHRELDDYQSGRKFHTIRAGDRWKAGDMFSPRVWSGKPYQSKMIKLAEDVRIEKVWDFAIEFGFILVDGVVISDRQIEEIAKNDGLKVLDFLVWFKFPKPFSGQIICWDKTIEYGADRISEVS